MIRVDIIASASTQTTVAEQGLEGYEISECRVKTQLNSVSAAELRVPPTNTHIQAVTSSISPVVTIYDDDRLTFIGSVASHTTDIFGNVTIQLDGALSWLNDITKAPFYVDNKTHAEYIETIITQYNAAVVDAGASERQIAFGGVVGFTGNVDIHHSGEYTTTLELLREAVEMYGGYFIEDFGGVGALPSVGWIREPIADSGVMIEYGLNELSLENQLDFSDFATRVYGATSDGLTAYAVDSVAEQEYGRRDYALDAKTKVTPEYDEAAMEGMTAEQKEAYKAQKDTEARTTAQADLQAEVEAELAKRKTPIRTIEVTAAELNTLGQSVASLHVGSTATLLDRKLGNDIALIVNAIDRDLMNRANTRITLGRESTTLTRSIGGGGGSSSSGGGGSYMPVDAVTYTAQSRTASEKAAARDNIGAASADSVPTTYVRTVNGMSGDVIVEGGSGGGDVLSVNGQTGVVVLTASDVGAMPSNTVVPSKTSQLTNDSGFITLADLPSAESNNVEALYYNPTQNILNDKNGTRTGAQLVQTYFPDVRSDVWFLFAYDTGGNIYQFYSANRSTNEIKFRRRVGNVDTFLTLTGNSSTVVQTTETISGSAADASSLILTLNSSRQTYNGSSTITGLQIKTLIENGTTVSIWDGVNNRMYHYIGIGIGSGNSGRPVFTCVIGGTEYRLAVYEASYSTNESTNTVLPEVTASNNGQVLLVSNGAWGVGNAPGADSTRLLPEATSSDEGKIAKVNELGNWELGVVQTSQTNALVYDEAQTLTDSNKLQVRKNVGLYGFSVALSYDGTNIRSIGKHTGVQTGKSIIDDYCTNSLLDRGFLFVDDANGNRYTLESFNASSNTVIFKRVSGSTVYCLTLTGTSSDVTESTNRLTVQFRSPTASSNAHYELIDEIHPLALIDLLETGNVEVTFSDRVYQQSYFYKSDTADAVANFTTVSDGLAEGFIIHAAYPSGITVSRIDSSEVFLIPVWYTNDGYTTDVSAEEIYANWFKSVLDYASGGRFRLNRMNYSLPWAALSYTGLELTNTGMTVIEWVVEINIHTNNVTITRNSKNFTASS